MYERPTTTRGKTKLENNDKRVAAEDIRDITRGQRRL